MFHDNAGFIIVSVSIRYSVTSHQHHSSSSSAINTLLLFVSFKSIFVDALSAVLILFIVSSVVRVLFFVFVCVFSVLIVSGTNKIFISKNSA